MNGAETGQRDPERIDAEFVIYRLEEAGTTLLTLPGSVYTTKMRASHLDVVREAADVVLSEAGHMRPAAPAAAAIDRMDAALAWVSLIPQDRYVLRRIVGARSLVSPITQRHLFSWRRIGGLLGADHKAVQRWHSEGVRMIVAALRGDQMAKGKPRTVQDAIAAVNAARKGRTRPPGYQPRDDEMLVAEIERLRACGKRLRDAVESIGVCGSAIQPAAITLQARCRQAIASFDAGFAA
jgi:hypothetical protein